MCNCWCERWFPEPKCTCTLVGRCRCWLEFVAWWKTKLSPQVQICQRWLYSRIMILAMPTLEENIVLIQSSLFTLMIIVVCKLDYLMYIKYVNTGDSSLTAERSFFGFCLGFCLVFVCLISFHQFSCHRRYCRNLRTFVSYSNIHHKCRPNFCGCQIWVAMFLEI